MSKILETVECLTKEARGIRKKILDGEDVLRNTERLIALEAIMSEIEKRLLEQKARDQYIDDFLELEY